jgi:O-antigen/teichoic acid export membrane protein
MRLLPDSRRFIGSMGLLLLLNLLIKPVWVFGIDRQVQNITGYETYGHYFALFSLTLVFQFLLDLGITPYFNRAVSVSQSEGPILFSQAIVIKLFLGFLYSGIVLTIAWFTNAYSGTLLLLLIMLQVISSFHMLLRSYLSASQKFVQDAWVSVTDKIFVIAVAGAMILFPGLSGGITINQFVLVQAGGLVFAMLLAIYFLYQHNVEVTIRPLKNFSLGILKQSLPFALNIFFMSAVMRADGFMLERLSPLGAYDAGTYASAFRLNDAVNMAGYTMSAFLLPYIARAWTTKGNFIEALNLSRQFLILPAICLAAAAPFISQSINQLLYHGREAKTSEVINILFLCLPAYAIIQTHGTLLTASGNIKPFMMVSAIFAATLIIVDLFVLPVYGSFGAAWVAVGIQNCFALAIYILCWKRTGIGIRAREWAAYLMLGLGVFLVFKYLIL